MRWLVSCTVLLLLLAGCQGGEVDPRPGSGDVYTNFDYASDDGYTIAGTVELELYTDEQVRFEDVTACLFDSDGTLLNSSMLGDLSSPDSEQRLSISADVQPRYVVIDHPEFHAYGALDTVAIRWANGTVGREQTIEEFEYHPPDEPGKCGTGG